MGERRRYASSTDVARLAGVSQSAVSRTSRGPQRLPADPGQGPGGGRPARLPAQPDPPDHADASQLPGRDRRRRDVQSVLRSGARAVRHQAARDRLPAAPRSCRQRRFARRRAATLASYRVDAIVSALAIRSAGSAGQLAQLADPRDRVQHRFRNAWVSSVSADNEQAGRIIAELLFERGGSRFGFIPGARASAASEARLKGFRSGLRCPWRTLAVAVTRADSATRMALRRRRNFIGRDGSGRHVLRQRPDRHGCHGHAASSIGTQGAGRCS